MVNSVRKHLMTASGALAGGAAGAVSTPYDTALANHKGSEHATADHRRRMMLRGAAGALAGGTLGHFGGRALDGDLSDDMKNAVRLAGAGVLTAAGTYATKRVLDDYDAASLQRKRPMHIESMREEYPEIRRLSPAVLEKSYDAVARYAPDTLDNPIVGGELLLRVANKQNAMVGLRDARTLTNLEGQSRERDLLDALLDRGVNLGVEGVMKKTGSVQSKYDLTDEQMRAVGGRVIDMLEKSANASGYKPPSMLSTLAVPAVGALAAAATAYAVPAAIDAIGNMRVRANRDKYLAEMKKVHPDMRNISDADLHVAYNSIAQHTPDVLKDPLLGGQTLKQMAQFRMANVQSLNEISRLRGQKPLDVALQNSTQFLAQGMADAAKGYLQQRQENVRAEMLQQRLQQSAEQQQYRVTRDSAEDKYRSERDTALDKQFEQRMGLSQAEQQYREKRDTAQDTYRTARDATLDKQFAERIGLSRDEQQYREKRDTAQDTYRTARDTVLDTQFNRQQSFREADAVQRDAIAADQMALQRASFEAQQGYNQTRAELDLLKARLGAAVDVANAERVEYTFDPTGTAKSHREYYYPDASGTPTPALPSWMQNVVQSINSLRAPTRPSAPPPSFNPRRKP